MCQRREISKDQRLYIHVKGVKYASTIHNNVSNVTHVEDGKDGICGFYTNVNKQEAPVLWI